MALHETPEHFTLNLDHLALSEIKDFNVLDGVRCLRLNAKRPRRRLHLGEAQATFCLLQDQRQEAILSRRTLTDSGRSSNHWFRVRRGARGAPVPTTGGSVMRSSGWRAGEYSGETCRRNGGTWRTVHSRFRRWTLAGVWESFFETLKRYAKNLNPLTLPEIKDLGALKRFDVWLNHDQMQSACEPWRAAALCVSTKSRNAIGVV